MVDGETGTNWLGFFAWLVPPGDCCLGNFRGVGFFLNILVWILQKFTGKETRDTVLGSFYEFYIKVKN